MPKGIPIRVAKEILEEYGLTQVVILYKDGKGKFGRTSHEVTPVGRSGQLVLPGFPIDVLGDIWSVMHVEDEDDYTPSINE